MLLFSINTFWSLTQALSTLRKVWVARLTAMLTASSKLSSDVALISVTRATDIEEAPGGFNRSAQHGRFWVLSGPEVRKWRDWVVQEGCPRRARGSCGNGGGPGSP